MNGWHKLTESFTIADLRVENERLQKTIKGLLHDLTVQTDALWGLQIINLQQQAHIQLLHEIVSEPEPTRWLKYWGMFAAGMVVMAVIAGVMVSL